MPAVISKAELFARLEQGHAAQVTVVTPNKRLSQARWRSSTISKPEKSHSVEAPDILPSGAFVERLWEDAPIWTWAKARSSSRRQEQHPLAGNPRDSELPPKEGGVAVPRGLRLVHQWRINAAQQRRSATRARSTSAARARTSTLPAWPDLVMAQHLDRLKKPSRRLRVRCHASANEGFFGEAAVRRMQPRAVEVHRAHFRSPRSRLRRSGRGPPGKSGPRFDFSPHRRRRPDLHKRRAEVVRVRAMQPGYNLPARRRPRCRSLPRWASRCRHFRWSTTLDSLELAFRAWEQCELLVLALPWPRRQRVARRGALDARPCATRTRTSRRPSRSRSPPAPPRACAREGVRDDPGGALPRKPVPSRTPGRRPQDVAPAGLELVLRVDVKRISPGAPWRTPPRRGPRARSRRRAGAAGRRGAGRPTASARGSGSSCSR